VCLPALLVSIFVTTKAKSKLQYVATLTISLGSVLHRGYAGIRAGYW